MVAKTLTELLGWDEEELGSEDSDSEEDLDYVPGVEKEMKRKPTTGKKKRKKRKQAPDLRELSLPKPARRLDADIDLGDAALTGSTFDDELKLSTACPRLPESAPAEAKVVILVGRKPTRGTAEDPRLTEARAIMNVQLAGMPFYYDAYHALLTLDAAGSEDIVGAATFRLGLLHTKQVRTSAIRRRALMRLSFADRCFRFSPFTLSSRSPCSSSTCSRWPCTRSVRAPAPARWWSAL